MKQVFPIYFLMKMSKIWKIQKIYNFSNKVNKGRQVVVNGFPKVKADLFIRYSNLGGISTKCQCLSPQTMCPQLSSFRKLWWKNKDNKDKCRRKNNKTYLSGIFSFSSTKSTRWSSLLSPQGVAWILNKLCKKKWNYL